jgi:hypothetical protein
MSPASDYTQDGPVTAIYLNLRETEILAMGVEMMLHLDSSVILNEDYQQQAEELIKAREGLPGMARADQVIAEARERLPVLRSLQTALAEHGMTLERMQGEYE